MPQSTTPPSRQSRARPRPLALSEEERSALAEAVLESFVAQHPEVRNGAVVAEIPAPLRWMGMLAGAVITAVATASGIWVITTISDVQLTVTRIDERIAGNDKRQEERYEGLDRRLLTVESKLDIVVKPEKETAE